VIQYAIRRFLVLIPTFFFISLVIFVVLNVAPGAPGAVGAAGGGETQGRESRESLRIFKEQFGLDRPILVNTRYLATPDEVGGLLRVANGLDPHASIGERLGAGVELEDSGEYLVLPLMNLAQGPDPVLREAALRQLPIAARLRFEGEGGGDAAEARLRNREIAAHNASIPDVTSSDEGLQTWQAWFAQHKDRYTYDTSERFAITFLDTRFARYWSNLFRLDFGLSTVDRRPVSETLMQKVGYSVTLSIVSLLLAYVLAVPLGVFSAVRQGTRTDTLMTAFLFMLYSLPSFFTGTVLLRLFSEGDPVAWFPTGEFSSYTTVPLTTWGQVKDVAWHLALPLVTYTTGSLATLSRYARSGVIEVIRADYIRTARAKGLSEPWVILRHAVRNGMIPILTLLGSLLPSLIAGSVVIEVIFNLPGMGSWLYSSINLRDYNAVMAVLLASSILSLIGVLLSDLSYALVDPRISLD
jgi:peptide/nickel transport system permease protein